MRRWPDPFDVLGALLLGALAVVLLGSAMHYIGVTGIVLAALGAACAAGAGGAWVSAWEDDDDDDLDTDDLAL
jgi:hypothetical protein